MTLLKEIGHAILGKDQDYTKMGIWRSIILLAVPMVLEMLMESLFSVFDMRFVSELGDEAVAVVGTTESLMTIIYALGFGIAMGVTGLIARRIGENKPKKASRASAQAINLGIVIAILVGIPGAYYAREILGLMSTEQEAIDLGWTYTSIMFGGNILIMLLFINNAIFRSAGNPALALYILFFANVINIILDYCLIFGAGPFPELGIKGAAIATNIGRGLGVIAQFILLIFKPGKIHLLLTHFRINIRVMLKVLYLSGGGILQFLIATSSWVILYRILGEYESEVVSGYAIGIRIFIFFLLPAWGMSNAAATLVGQNLGAKNPKQAEKSVWYTVLVNSVYMLLMSFLFIGFPNYLIDFFKIQTSLISNEVAITSMKIIGYGMIFYGLGMVMGQTFNGAGDTYTPTLINFIGFWLIEVPLAYYLAIHIEMEQNGVFYSILIAETVVALLGLSLFMRGKWKLRKV